MPKHQQSNEVKSDESNQTKVKPGVVPEQAQELTTVIELPVGSLYMVGDGTVETQAARLGDSRFRAVQRQAMAAWIGQVQGNGHLQGIIQNSRHNQHKRKLSVFVSSMNQPSVQRDWWDTTKDVGSAIGKGVYSAGEDLVGGAARTARGLNVFDTEEQLRISGENERAFNLLANLVSNRKPLQELISLTIEHFYAKLPDDVKIKITRAIKHGAMLGGAKLVGRMVVGKQIATILARRIAIRIAATQIYKTVATKLGVSAGAGSTGIGIPITLLMIQGTLERAGDASRRLSVEDPELYRILSGNNLDMAWFLVERHLGELRGEFDEMIEELKRKAEELQFSAPSSRGDYPLPTENERPT